MVQCNTCQSRLSSPDNTAGLQVAIDPFATRNICAYLESYFEPETIEYRCTACQREYPAVRQIQLVGTPNLIMVQLKRFKWNDGRLQKLTSLVECPLAITFSSKEFELIASISHVGSVNSGHYVAFCKRQGDWFKFNDESVQRCNGNEVISRNSYVIFYARNSSGGGGSE